MSNNTELVIPVAFATDTNYIVPTIVAVKSLIDHCSNSLNYILYLLTEEELNKRTLKIFRSLIKEKHNIKIVYLTVGKLIENVQLCTNGPTKGISKVTYYRFLLPELITGFDKVLYLDTDIIIRKDISSIFVTNIDEYYVAGVHDIVGYQIEEERCKELNINSLDSYVNAGVLLLNLKKSEKIKRTLNY
ncbi:glycosyltransferase family 8 protein [Ruminococcus sp.]|uniref:glycosyltransferase family 8 protein n=1 Tax=Ruminococcus sp. TaxID=41978 RepID=UPI002E75A08F|nr:glycosyltransferase [Ruminococcus sp.]MEE1396888.1 glycosyltransferase [Ruminococcus sp.]